LIPTIVDQQGAAGTFFAGGGGGNATGTGQPSTLGGGSISGGGATSPVNGGANQTTSPSGTTTAPGSTTAPGTSAPGGTGSGSTGTGSGQAAPGPMFVESDPFPVRVAMADDSSGLPSMLQQYAAAENGSRSTAINAHTLQANAASGNNNSNFSSGGHNNYAVRLSINQAIDIFGLVPASLDVLHRTRDFYAIDLDRVSNELALTVKNDYYTVLRDNANVAADQEQVRSATENVRITTAKFNAGQAARYDVLTAETTLANDTQTLISAENQLAIDGANLNSLLGLPLDDVLGLTTPALPPLDQPIDLGGAVTTAYKDRPELRQADNNVAIAQRLVRLSGASLLPSLTVSGEASHNGPSYPNVTADNYSVTANLAIPIYDGGATQSKVHSAESDLRTQQITRDQLKQNVTLEVRQAYLNTMSARSAVSAAEVGVTQASDAARLAEVRFQTGVGTFLDVINAEAQLATARTNLATAEFQYQTSLAQLTRAEGGR
jgi:outer membrane protein TolC